jgi:hypothetical protein
MKALIVILSIITLMSCQSNQKYKHVIAVCQQASEYEVTVTNQKGGNTLERTAGGAIVGGGVDLLFGGSGTAGAIVGGLIGAATTDEPVMETRKIIRQEIIYTIIFSDGSQKQSINYLHYNVGDSVIIY